METKNSDQYLPYFYGVVLVALLLTSLFAGDAIFFDESYYLNNLKVLQAHGLSSDFLLGVNGPAGPTHALYYFVFDLFLPIEFPYVRIMSLLLLLGSMWIAYLLFSALGKPQPLVLAGSILFVPYFGVSFGMLLTEAPSIFSCFASFYLLHIALSRYEKKWAQRILLLVLAGFFAFLAFLGRQPLLLALPAFGLSVLLLEPGKAKAYLPFLFSCLAPLFLVFWVWQDYKPLNASFIDHFTNYPVFFVFLALGYLFFAVLLLQPKQISWLVKKPLYLLLFFTAIFLLNFFVLKDNYAPMSLLASKFLGSGAVYRFYGYLGASLLYFFAVLMLVILVKELFISYIEADLFRLAALFTILLVCASCVMIKHQFSSRYVTQAAFFIVLAFPVSGNYKVARLLVSSTIAISSLFMFLHY